PRAVLALAAASDEDDCDSPESDFEKNYCRQGSNISGILRTDAVSAYKYYFLDRLLGDTLQTAWVDSELEKLAARLSPNEIADAQAQAQKLYAKIRGGNG